jgi:hypothetical protein
MRIRPVFTPRGRRIYLFFSTDSFLYYRLSFSTPSPESYYGLRVIRIIYSQRRWGRPNEHIQLHDRVACRVGLLGLHDAVSLDLVLVNSEYFLILLSFTDLYADTDLTPGIPRTHVRNSITRNTLLLSIIDRYISVDYGP